MSITELRCLALYARCFRATDDFSVEVESFGLHWRVGHRADSPIRARGVTVESDTGSLLRVLRDAAEFMRRIRLAR